MTSSTADISGLESAGLTHIYQGKVRDIYKAGDDQLLMVASDRISAYDVIMSEDIPDKGAVLNGVSSYWFENTKHIIENHCISTDVTDFPASGVDSLLRGRAMLVKKTTPIRLECIVRGFLFGHGYEEYLNSGSVHGVSYGPGMQLAQELPEPIFSPTTKAEEGHDENISPEGARELVGSDVYDFIAQKSIELYKFGAARAKEVGIILCDTKFEFGFYGDGIILIDEAMTPDSSRYWEASTYEIGKSPASFDKQYLRDWLDSTGWDHTPPAPTLPEDVINGTRARYVEAYERLTGKSFTDWV